MSMPNLDRISLRLCSLAYLGTSLIVMFSASDWRDINHSSLKRASTSLYPHLSFTSTRVYLRLILMLFQNDMNKGTALISVIQENRLD